MEGAQFDELTSEVLTRLNLPLEKIEKPNLRPVSNER
jgi:hypothetical protein